MLIFGTGVVTGGLLVAHSGYLRPARTQRPVAARPAPPAAQAPAGGPRLEFLRRVQRELDLTPAQRERVDAILNEGQERTRKIMDPVMPRLREELQRTKDEFRAVLVPEQQARFDALIKHPMRPHEPRQGPPPIPRRQADVPPPPQPGPP